MISLPLPGGFDPIPSGEQGLLLVFPSLHFKLSWYTSRRETPKSSATRSTDSFIESPSLLGIVFQGLRYRGQVGLLRASIPLPG